MLMHATINNAKGLIPAPPRAPASVLLPYASPISWLGVSVLWLIAGYLLLRMRALRPSREPTSGA
jgi:hypothetical protein